MSFHCFYVDWQINIWVTNLRRAQMHGSHCGAIIAVYSPKGKFRDLLFEALRGNI